MSAAKWTRRGDVRWAKMIADVRYAWLRLSGRALARSQCPAKLVQLVRDVMDTDAAVRAVRAWLGQRLGPAAAELVERACLLDGRDTWHDARARRKLCMFLVWCLSPVRISAREACGGNMNPAERVAALLGVPRTWWTTALAPRARGRAWSIRTTARDLAEIQEIAGKDSGGLVWHWHAYGDSAHDWERGHTGRPITRYVLRLQAFARSAGRVSRELEKLLREGVDAEHAPPPPLLKSCSPPT